MAELMKIINWEWVKLISIIVSGFIFIIIAFIIQKKNMKEKNRIDTHNFSDFNYTSISDNEKKAKIFIESYKSKFGREDIKNSLIKANMAESEIESYLNKYY